MVSHSISVGSDRMDAYLDVPPTQGCSPAVVLCPGLTRDIGGLDFLRDALLVAGYAVLGIRYRGMDLLKDDDDVRAALDFLTEDPRVDPARIAMVGHSRGSMASLRTAAHDDRVRAVVAIHPVTDFLGYVRATRAYSPDRFEVLKARFGGADPESNPEPYERFAAIRYAPQITAPTLLIAGTSDLHSPLHHSTLMRDELVKHGNAAVHLEVIEGSGHFFEVYYGSDCRDLTARHVREWMRAYV